MCNSSKHFLNIVLFAKRFKAMCQKGKPFNLIHTTILNIIKSHSLHSINKNAPGWAPLYLYAFIKVEFLQLHFR